MTEHPDPSVLANLAATGARAVLVEFFRANGLESWEIHVRFDETAAGIVGVATPSSSNPMTGPNSFETLPLEDFLHGEEHAVAKTKSWAARITQQALQIERSQ